MRGLLAPRPRTAATAIFFPENVSGAVYVESGSFKGMETLIKAMMEAPEWLRVRTVTVETQDERTVLAREELVGYQFPITAFTLTVEIAPSRRA